MRVQLFAPFGSEWKNFTGDAVYPPRVGHEFVVIDGDRINTTPTVTAVLSGGEFLTSDGALWRIDLLDGAAMRIVAGGAA